MLTYSPEKLWPKTLAMKLITMTIKWVKSTLVILLIVFADLGEHTWLKMLQHFE